MKVKVPRALPPGLTPMSQLVSWWTPPGGGTVRSPPAARSAGQLVDSPRGGHRPVRRHRTLGWMRGSRVGTDTGNRGRAPVPCRYGPCAERVVEREGVAG